MRKKIQKKNKKKINLHFYIVENNPKLNSLLPKINKCSPSIQPDSCDFPLYIQIREK